MQVKSIRTWVPDADADVLVLPVSRSGEALEVAGTTHGVPVDSLSTVLTAADRSGFKAKPESTFVATLIQDGAAHALVLTGIGDKSAVNAYRLAQSAGAGTRAARDLGYRRLTMAIPDEQWGLSGSDAIEAVALGVRLALYRFEKYRGEASRGDNGHLEVEEAFVLAPDVSDDITNQALTRAAAIGDGVNLARDLSNEPASTLTPEAFAATASDVASRAGLAIDILDPDQLRDLGANAMLAVGGGSANPPRLIRLRYEPEGKANDGRVVGLVGKAITFDTGGYSIKPYDAMLEMKGDMAGGAAVLGTMSALSALGCPTPVEATICAAENMISGLAFRPGDVIKGMNGVTMEILSTDAEGRLVLADGLVDTARRGATELIDLATLTGAAVVALGDGASALFSNDDEFAARLLDAAAATGERTWRMPLFAELEKKIKGDVADIKNSGGRSGGAITAALFLQHFTEGLPWAHFDIAGANRQSKATALGPKGATGVGVQTLLRYLAP